MHGMMDKHLQFQLLQKLKDVEFNTRIESTVEESFFHFQCQTLKIWKTDEVTIALSMSVFSFLSCHY